MKRFFKSSYMAIILILIYLPLFIFMIISFNSSSNLNHLTGLSLQWYKQLFLNTSFIQAIALSLFIAISSTIISVIVGTFAAIGISRSQKVTQKFVLSINKIPLINADVITAVALMTTFIAFSIPFGFGTLLLAHISFDIPYVVITILPRLRKVDQNLINASLDLGARPSQTLRKVVIPVLKPAIITAAAIAFAMSFDDFMISYFNGGSDANVSVFIYSMKRLSPVVNAFGTISIVLIGGIFISWNFYFLIKKQKIKFKKSLINNTYRDNKIIRLNFKITKLYYFLNHKINDLNKDKLRIKIHRYERILNKESQWIKDYKEQYILKIKKKEIQTSKQRTHLRWLMRAWKPVTLIFIAISAFAILTAFYIISNKYDLVVANWGNYLTPNMLQKFEKENNVKVKYNTFDSNEELYIKLYTTKYDVMVPSDYMVKKLAAENRLAKINYKLLNNAYNNFNIYKPESYQSYLNDKNPSKYLIDKNFAKKEFGTATIPTDFETNSKKYATLEPGLIKQLYKNKWSNKEKVVNEDISQFSIPYLWGDLRLIINTNKKSNIQFLKDEYPGIKLTSTLIPNSGQNHFQWSLSSPISWKLLWDAAKVGKRVLLNNDFKNLFMTASELNYQTVAPTTVNELNTDGKSLSNLILNKNVSLMGDEIINSVRNGNFDFALMYNGDAIDSDRQYYNEFKNNNKPIYKFLIKIPRFHNQKNNLDEGTNVYSDNMVISKDQANNPLAYKFVAFLIKNGEKISKNLATSTPILQIRHNLVDNNGEFTNYKAEFIPLYYKPNPEQTFPSDGPFLSNPSIDKLMLNWYNKILSEKN